ncbi:hypothetical protein RNJ44_04657 [Nakaseomyces bracarensis]|uniref:Uncharacterized protein n=1 Tax=Nakaseomyces bracarensis TaxID=273131 RepID=A0ABR4NVY1_9SACH
MMHMKVIRMEKKTIIIKFNYPTDALNYIFNKIRYTFFFYFTLFYFTLFYFYISEFLKLSQSAISDIQLGVIEKVCNFEDGSHIELQIDSIISPGSKSETPSTISGYLFFFFLFLME